MLHINLPTQNVILLSHGRCGTNLLCRLLSQYSCISNNNEIAVEFPKKDNKFFFDKKIRLKLQKKFPFSKNFSEYIELARSICDKKFMLFKMFPHHFNNKGWEVVFQEKSKFILLTRNHLDSFLSQVQAELYDCYFLKNTTNYKIKFIKEDFEKMYERRKKNLSYIKNVLKLYPDIRNKIITIDYDDIFSETKQKRTVKKILKFLNITNEKKNKFLIPYGKFKQNKSINFNFVSNKQEMILFMKSNEVTKKILENSIYYKKL